jgi:hypothetical protein
MNDRFTRYFSGEMNEHEKIEFLSCINADSALKEEFFEIQNLLGVSELLPRTEDNDIVRLSLTTFNEHLKAEKDT